MTLIAAFKVLLSRHSGQQDIVIGTDVANRTQTETENLIGFFVNLLPIRTDLSGNPSFCELLQQVKKTTLGAFAHQDLPFEKLVEDLQPERDLSRNPLVQVLFVFQNVSQQTFELSDLHLSSMELGGKTSRFDLVLFMGETSEGLVGRWRYNTDLFEGATTFRLATHFQRLLESIVTEPETRVNSLEMLSEVEKEQQRMEKSERQEAQIRKLKSIRRKAVDLTQGVS
jgi:non-ribosomal peptide synthetase component F